MMKTLPLFFLCLVSLPLISQTIISGQVKDASGETVTGANVFIAGTYDGTSSDAEGKFEFETEAEEPLVLRVTFIGYVPYETSLILPETKNLSIILVEDFNRLSAVIITAGSFTAGEGNKSEVMKPIDIVTTAGATADIPGALNTLPGTQTVGETGRLFVRGGDGYETKTFIDGMEVMNEYSPTAPNTPSRSRFSPFMFKGTSFSTGGYSAEFGQANSSALILKSKDIAEETRTDFSLMSVGADISHSHALPKGAVAAKLEYTNLTPYFVLLPQELEWDKAPASLNGNIMFRQALNDKNMLKVYTNMSHSDFIIYQQPILPDLPDVRVALTNTYGYFNTTHTVSLGADWTIRSGISYTHSLEDTESDRDHLKERENGLHLKSVATHEVTEKVLVTMGAEHFRRDYRFSYNQEGSQEGTLPFNQQMTSIFAESDIYLSAKFVSRLGIRTEYNSRQEKFYVAPRFSLAYKTDEFSQISLAYGRFNQSGPGELTRMTNELTDERASHYILNYQRVKEGRTFRVEAYHKSYDDLIKYSGDLFDPAGFNNHGDGYARGLDFFWRDSETFQGVDYWLSYSYLDTERDYRQFPTTAVPTFASDHNFSAVIKYFIQSLKTQLGATYSFTSGRPYHDPNQPGFNAHRTPAYHDLSMNLSYLMRSNIIIHGSVTNVLGVKNIFGYESSVVPDAGGEYVMRAIRPQAPRFIFIGVFITLSKDGMVNQLPVL
jgi:hypothetical protein